jgi:methylmalonyl-CoA mutase N-terminal domain/subunit
MRLITDVFEFCSKEVPKWNTISISGYHIREAGSTAVQELAFTLANGKSYLKAALEKGLDINVFAKRLSFFFNCHNNFFEEIAKFRAARRMWALAGSFFVENLTDEIETAAWKYIETIDAMGGSVEAIESGYMQKEIGDAAYQYQTDLENNERILVGVNKYTDKQGIHPEVFRVDDSIRQLQIDKLEKLKAERNAHDVEEALLDLTQAVRNNSNTMPYILKAVEAYATLGEIADTLRKEFGEY